MKLFYGQPYMMICVESWDYMLILQQDQRFRLWHHVTPADGGYGREVDLYLPGDYFKSHTVKQFYEMVAQQQTFHPKNEDKRESIRILTEQLHSAGWLD